MCGANDEGTSLKRVCCIERAAKGKVIFQVIGVVKSNKSLSFVAAGAGSIPGPFGCLNPKWRTRGAVQSLGVSV